LCGFCSYAPGEIVPNDFRTSYNPAWAKDKSVGYKMINARAEGIASKPAFRWALKARGCLVVASGFYEWQKTPAGKQPYWIGLARSAKLPCINGRPGRGGCANPPRQRRYAASCDWPGQAALPPLCCSAVPSPTSITVRRPSGAIPQSVLLRWRVIPMQQATRQCLVDYPAFGNHLTY
jgi:hypothetical protein